MSNKDNNKINSSTNNKPSKDHLKLIAKTLSLFLTAFLVFVLGVFVGSFFGDKNKNLSDYNQFFESSPRRDVASTVVTDNTLTVHKMEKEQSVVNKDRKITSVPDDGSIELNQEILSGKFTIVVAEYDSSHRASLHVEDLQSQGLVESFHFKVFEDNQLVYRVNIGIFDSVTEAQEKKAQLSDVIDLENATIKFFD